MTESKPEMIEVRAALGSAGDDISDMVLRKLVEEGRLPPDFQFRSLMLPQETRSEVVAQDVAAALGWGEPSDETYLSDPLPDCIAVPVVQRTVLRQLDEPYHTLGEFEAVVDEERRGSKAGSALARRAWINYVLYLDRDLGENTLRHRHPPKDEPRGTMSKERQYQYALRRILIKSAALRQIYDSQGVIYGQGPVNQELLKALLVDNYLELGS